jgi:uncharacterized membrane protein
MSRKTIYFPHSYLVFAALLLVLILVVGLIFIGVVGLAFRDVGFSPITVALVLVCTFLGSYVNIPILRLKTSVPVVKEEFVSFFGVVYRIPQVGYNEAVTVVAVNVGGALIPTVVSFYLLWKMPSVILISLVGVFIVAVITHVVARPVKGVGIVTPALVSPLVAALSAIILPSVAPRIVAYAGGVLGTLIGADLSNLNVIPKLGAPIASIGGAGTFDGVFLSGIIAVLLAYIL